MGPLAPDALRTLLVLNPGEFPLSVDGGASPVSAKAILRVSQEIRGHLLSHGVTGVQAASYDGHDNASQKLEALETLQRFLTETSACVVHIASRVAA